MWVDLYMVCYWFDKRSLMGFYEDFVSYLKVVFIVSLYY